MSNMLKMIEDSLMAHHLKQRGAWFTSEKLRVLADNGIHVEVVDAETRIVGEGPLATAEAKVTIRVIADTNDGNQLNITTTNVGSCLMDSKQWPFSKEYAPMAAFTRAIGRALSTLFPRLFAMDESLGSLDETAVLALAAIDRALDARTTDQLKKSVDELKELSPLVDDQMRSIARKVLMIMRDKLTIKNK
ncbi:MAG: hypothetical protein D6790_00810 [Caldilineae bacterium]|nr:MAG: hypothetical protein D6790_00810 [Caldilineae bacterium]